jgi:hypothetical protein
MRDLIRQGEEMKRAKTLPIRNRNGSALMLSLIFIAMFSALAAAMATLSGVNVQVAENLRQVDTTRSCAESGLEVVRYWANKVEIPGTTAPDQRFGQLAASLQNQLAAAGITNLVPVLSGSTITISDVPLLSSTAQSFSAILTKIDNDNIRLDVTGHYGLLSRTIRSNYTFGERAHTVFDFGIASKGPLSLTGNVDLDGYNIDVESNAYIDSDDLLALSIIGNSMIAGEVKIRNNLANVHMQGHSGVGGEYGAGAMNHIAFGVPPSEFPDMNPAPFIPYATNVLSPTASLSSNATYENLRIPAGRNPSFSGNLTLKGVIFVETPNVVSFSGNVNITGIIVTNGSSTDNSGENKITFTGNITCHPITQLPQLPQFQGLQSQTGTFLLAPGFKTSFGGNFGTLSGAIAANGIRFYGNAGGVINGSIINYSTATLELSGNSDLRFNRSGLEQVPAGFAPDIVLNYDRSSYSEVVL